MIKKLIGLYKRTFWTPEKYARSLGVRVGENCSIATKHFGSEPYLLEIGDHVQITDGVRFFQHGGGWVFRDRDPEFDCFGKIKVGNNVYIGNCALIMPGVTVGNNVIIGAGAVVTKSINDNLIVGGNPLQVIGNVEQYFQRISKYNVKTKQLNASDKLRVLKSLNEEQFLTKNFILEQKP